MSPPSDQPKAGDRGGLASLLASALLAVGLLSRLPTPFVRDVTERELKRSVAFYPAAGALLGGLLAVASEPLADGRVPLLGGVLLTALLAALTGALHLDGVADFFDAIGSGKGRERMLEIMKDSRIGAHGACALVLVLLAKVALFDAALSTRTPLFFVLVPALGRLAAVPVIVLFKSARAGGLGQTVSGRPSPTVLGLCLIFAGMLLGLCGSALPLLAALGTALLLGYYASHKLGGTTGDVYGAAIEFSELSAAMTLLYL